MAGQSRDNALDHVVVVFENRSLDNLLGPCTGRSRDLIPM
jgi:phospholipase C